jgi:hypothetical protein
MKTFISGLILGILAMIFLGFFTGPGKETGRYQLITHGEYYTIKLDTATGESWIMKYLDTEWEKIKDSDSSFKTIKKKSSTQPKLDVQPVIEEKINFQPAIKDSSKDKSNYDDLIPNPK